jgi:hypothetical protein
MIKKIEKEQTQMPHDQKFAERGQIVPVEVSDKR